MKYKIAYGKAEDVLIVKTEGCMTGKDFVAMAKDIVNHPYYRTNGNVLFDHRELNFSNASIDDIDKIRRFHKENESKIGNGKSAIVVESQSEWNDLWSQGERIKTGNIVRVFDKFDYAVHWIKEE